MSVPTNTRQAPTDSKGRLKQVKLNGKSLNATLTEQCVSASLSSSMTSITELSFTFADDHNATLFRSGLFRDGTVVEFAHWRGRVLGGGRLRPGRGGPEVQVTAPSLFVHKLQHQTGERNWGSMSVNQWVRDRVRSVGMAHMVEPYIGVTEIVRAAPDKDSEGDPESTWDVMVALAEKYDAWMFEHSARLIFARPGKILTEMPIRRRVPLVWRGWGDMSEALMGMPEFTPGERAEQKLSVRVVGSDVDRICPGDAVILSGNLNGGTTELNANGSWIVEGVTVPLTGAEAVKLDCIRPVKGAL